MIDKFMVVLQNPDLPFEKCRDALKTLNELVRNLVTSSSIEL
jgi:hypothetical protein